MPAAYRITARRLLDAMAEAKTNPKARFGTGDWTDPYWTAADLRRWFAKCLDAKINRDLPLPGNKAKEEYQYALAVDARIVNAYYGRRVRNHGANLLRTKAMKRRYPHIDNPERDD